MSLSGTGEKLDNRDGINPIDVLNEGDFPVRVETSPDGSVSVLRAFDKPPPSIIDIDTEILSPRQSLIEIRESDLPIAAQRLMENLINKGRIFEHPVGVIVDYSNFLNRVVDPVLVKEIAEHQVPIMEELGANCILSPDSSGPPLAIMNAAMMGIPLFRLQKQPSLTMDTAIGVHLGSFTRLVEDGELAKNVITANVRDFPHDRKIRAVIDEDIIDTAAMAVAVVQIVNVLRSRGIDIEVVGMFAPWIKSYTGSRRVLERLGIPIHSIVDIEGLVPMDNSRPRGMIKIAGIDSWLTLNRTDLNENS